MSERGDVCDEELGHIFYNIPPAPKRHVPVAWCLAGVLLHRIDLLFEVSVQYSPDAEPQALCLGQPQLALVGVCGQPSRPELFSYHFQLLEVLSPSGGMYDDIISVGCCILVVGLQDDVHQSPKCHWCPMEAKQEDLVLPVPQGHREGSLGLHLRGQSHLPVPVCQMESGNELCPPKVIHNVLHLRGRVAIKLHNLFEPPEVIADPEATVRLGDNDSGLYQGQTDSSVILSHSIQSTSSSTACQQASRTW